MVLVGAGAVPGAVASSFEWCELMQPVDLVAALQYCGFSRPQACQLLDAGLPLEFSLCFGARNGGGSKCEVGFTCCKLPSTGLA